MRTASPTLVVVGLLAGAIFLLVDLVIRLLGTLAEFMPWA
jgi:hypothetical protein